MTTLSFAQPASPVRAATDVRALFHMESVERVEILLAGCKIADVGASFFQERRKAGLIRLNVPSSKGFD